MELKLLLEVAPKFSTIIFLIQLLATILMLKEVALQLLAPILMLKGVAPQLLATIPMLKDCLQQLLA